MWISASCSCYEEIMLGTPYSIIFLANPVTMYILTGHSQVDISIMIEIQKRICGQNTEKAELAVIAYIVIFFLFVLERCKVHDFQKTNNP